MIHPFDVYSLVLSGSGVRSPSRVQLFVTPWTVALQASLSLTISWHLPKFMSIALVVPSSHLILWCPLLLPSIIPSISFGYIVLLTIKIVVKKKKKIYLYIYIYIYINNRICHFHYFRLYNLVLLITFRVCTAITKTFPFPQTETLLSLSNSSQFPPLSSPW